MDAKVPQRIDMEDKVVGPLTLNQFFYLLFGGLVIYILNNWTAGSFLRILFYPVALIVGALSFALAFVKINDRPFIYFLAATLRYLKKPRKRVWLKGDRKPDFQIVEKQEAPKEEVHKDFDRRKAMDLARLLDTNEGQK